MMLKLLDVIDSKGETKVRKYIFRNKTGFILEFSYIDKDDGKNIICVPNMTMCSFQCKFCHTTDYIGKVQTRQITSHDLVLGIDRVVEKEWLEDGKPLLISFMGCGDPLSNTSEIFDTMLQLTINYKKKNIPLVRFALATLFPVTDYGSFFTLCEDIKRCGLQVKLHISLHFTDDKQRKDWMPHASSIDHAIAAGMYFKRLTGNAVEIHYAMMSGVNDTDENVHDLYELVTHTGFNVKLLYYNKKQELEVEPSGIEQIKYAMSFHRVGGVEIEYYVPPGLDIGASCGQFILDYYEKYKDK